MKLIATTLRMISLLAFSLLMIACGSDPAGPDAASTTTTISGRVVDESNRPLAGVTVTGHGATTTTDAQGLYMLKNLSTPADRCFVTCTKSGFFTGIRAAIPTLGGSTPIEVVMITSTVAATVSSASPGTVTLPEGGKVELPPNGFTRTNGSAYTGQVQLLARRLNPESAEFGRLFPGDVNAVRVDGSEGSLMSYGVIIADLQTPSGERLQLASGSTATLTFPIPPTMLASAPDGMPLWFFDESIGRWKEEGSAVKVGSTYVGDVKHFTPWNCDEFFGPPCRVHIRVLTRKGKPAGGVRVRIGQIVMITDGNGDIWAFGTQETTAHVPAELNGGIGSGVVTIPCITGQQVEQTITIDGATVSGLVLDCERRALPSLVYATWPGGSNFVATGGVFNMFVPAGVPLTISALGGESRDVPALASGDSVGIGNLIVCQGGGGTGRPGVGSTYSILGIFFDAYGSESARVTIQYIIEAVRQSFAGKSDVTIYRQTNENGDRDSLYFAHEENGDISLYSADFYPDHDWALFPIASRRSFDLPAKSVQRTPSIREELRGRIEYGGTEQISIGTATLLAHRTTITTTTQIFEDNVPGGSSTSTEVYWYAPAVGFFAKAESTSSDPFLFQRVTLTLVSYNLK